MRPNPESNSLAVIHAQGVTALKNMRSQLATGGTDLALLQKTQALETSLKATPEKIVIMCDGSGSFGDDLPKAQKTIESLRSKLEAEDCPVIFFGDARTPYEVWDGIRPMIDIATNGKANRHEGGIQALMEYFKQANIDLTTRDPNSGRIDVHLLTDEHADGSLEGFELGREVKNDFGTKSVTNDNLKQIMTRLGKANIVLHAYTPWTNTETDYRGNDAIQHLGYLWQILAKLTGGDWHKLGSMPEAVAIIQAQTLTQLAQTQQLLQLAAPDTRTAVVKL